MAAPAISSPSISAQTVVHRAGLAAFAALGAAWVFVLVTLGAFTTSINAGMAFPDWPLSNGSLNPKGWLHNLSMFAEHSHRLSAGVMTLITIVLAVWLQLQESRRWLRRLGWFAVGLVLVQAVVGGLRVLLNTQIAAMLHACLAQIMACTLIAIAAACSRSWIVRPVTVGSGVRRFGRICCALLLVQLGIAAVMRHSFAGLAIPAFPWSTADHRWLPPFWNFKVGINFAHRCMAVVLAVTLTGFAVALGSSRTAPLGLRCGASVLVSLLALQILLGAAIVRTYRDPMITTAHVVVGALTLVTAFWLTWCAHRDALEAAP